MIKVTLLKPGRVIIEGYTFEKDKQVSVPLSVGKYIENTYKDSGMFKIDADKPKVAPKKETTSSKTKESK